MSHYQKKKKNKVAIVAEYPMQKLYSRFKDHHRLKVFANKGTKCVCCHIEGTRLVRRRISGKNGSYSDHIDIITENNILMTVDHMLPKCKKGSEDLRNKQPMCSKCNSEKGGKYVPILGRFSWFYRLKYLLILFIDNPKIKKNKRIINRFKAFNRKIKRSVRRIKKNIIKIFVKRKIIVDNSI